MKLHLGCGTNKLEGWVNIDSVSAVKPDLIHDITQPLPYKDQSVDEILAQDLLEHFDKYIRFIVFYEWVRVLRIGGKITIQVPNFKKLLLKYFKLGFDNFVDTIFGENLWGSKVYLGHFGNHKWGYSQKTLSDFVKLFGIEPIEINDKSLNIELLGIKKKHVYFDDIKPYTIYSHANHCGEGDSHVTLEYVKNKIDEFNNDEK